MKDIFSNERRVDYLLRCEGALALAQEKLGHIPKGCGEMINDRASTSYVALQRIEEIEIKNRHDIMALITALGEVVGKPASSYIHLGATSSDMLDSATALQIKDANKLLQERLGNMIQVLSRLSMDTRDVICLGRTHGQHAIPMTFGFKVGVWVMEFSRHEERFQQLKKRIEVGKMSGAVGTGAGFGSDSAELEKTAMGFLKLGVEEISTQVVQRDRYIELVCFLANIATTLEKIAVEIRNLQRSEIAEISEQFNTETQVGSSTMAQKVNPITCENVCGLARVVRGMVHPAMENAVLWHERDLANSSAERFIIPHAFIIVDDMLTKMEDVISHLSIDPSSMERKITENHDLSMVEAVIMALVKKGMARQEAHELMRRLSLTCRKKDRDLKTGLKKEALVMKMLDEKEIDHIIDPRNYLGHVQEKIDDHIVKLVRRQVQ